MIRVKKLKELLEKIPENAMANAYEGEDTGLRIVHNGKTWWIRARETDDEENYTEGFED